MFIPEMSYTTFLAFFDTQLLAAYFHTQGLETFNTFSATELHVPTKSGRPYKSVLIDQL